MRNTRIDMTQGGIVRLTFLFALPLSIGSILQLLYNTVDTIVVGRFCGAVSIAAVSTSAQPVEILLCVFLGIGQAVSILVAQAAGKNDQNQILSLCRAAVAFVYIASFCATLAGLVLGPFILRLMQVPDDTIGQAAVYIRIVLLGTLGQLGYNMNAGILRGLGDSKSSMLFLLYSCLLNIVLDLFFVAVLKMAVFGVALATTVATFCSWLLSMGYILKNYPELNFPVLTVKFEKPFMKKIVLLGLPLGLNSSLFSFGHTFLQALINTQGAVFMAGCAVAGRLTSLSGVNNTAFASAGLIFAGQNLGAGNKERIRRGGKLIPLLCGLITFSADMLILLFCKPFTGIFTSDPAVKAVAMHYIYVAMPFTWCYAVLNSIARYANGLGQVRYTTIVNLLMLWAVRIPAAFIITYFIDGYYIMAAISLSFIFGLIAMLFFYKTKCWKKATGIY